MKTKFRAPRLYRVSACLKSASTTRGTPSSDTFLNSPNVSKRRHGSSRIHVRAVVPASPDDLFNILIVSFEERDRFHN